MKIAILGACGRVGGRVISEALMRGHDVVGIDIVAAPELDKRVSYYNIDMLEEEKLTENVKGCDVYIFAVIPVLKGIDHITDVIKVSLNVCRNANIPRFLYICGGLSSWESPGIYLMDAQKKPGHRMTNKTNDAIIGSHEIALEYLRTIKDVDWVCQTAPLWMEENMGERTGMYRMGTEYPVYIDPDNKDLSPQQNCHISMEDFAVCMVDEIEQSRHHFCRFTVGY
ncbi:NAD(P)-dependent oxidoreductase [Diplocloster agilis]|uniref:NAD(P)H-binding protein n=1 Tax=Diplocloster agilis TaxID=2850323 RepID=A0A949NJ04_9FIRM|nr:NAD(P)H-binding protein [Diplocloster agilis]MBU9739215.1 NAD(P)H-binding protein [Diplocloster agilis]MBU9744892.1 NAD(P)H-binding protein [Diplocloster agilis]